MLTNTSNDEQFYKAGDIVGFFQPVPEEDILEHETSKKRRSFFGLFSGACSEKLSEEDRKFLEFLETLKILFI